MQDSSEGGCSLLTPSSSKKTESKTATQPTIPGWRTPRKGGTEPMICKKRDRIWAPIALPEREGDLVVDRSGDWWSEGRLALGSLQILNLLQSVSSVEFQVSRGYKDPSILSARRCLPFGPLGPWLQLTPISRKI